MNLIFIVGPPAVGKMTVGQELAGKLDYKLFHNHYSIELALHLFDYGTEEFKAINQGVLEMEKEFQMNTTGNGIEEENYIRIDNTDLSPAAAADLVMDRFGWDS